MYPLESFTSEEAFFFFFFTLEWFSEAQNMAMVYTCVYVSMYMTIVYLYIFDGGRNRAFLKIFSRPVFL